MPLSHTRQTKKSLSALSRLLMRASMEKTSPPLLSTLKDSRTCQLSTDLVMLSDSTEPRSVCTKATDSSMLAPTGMDHGLSSQLMPRQQLDKPPLLRPQFPSLETAQPLKSTKALSLLATASGLRLISLTTTPLAAKDLVPSTR